MMEQHSKKAQVIFLPPKTHLPSPQKARQKAGCPLLGKAPPHLPQQKNTDLYTAISKGSSLKEEQNKITHRTIL